MKWWEVFSAYSGRSFGYFEGVTALDAIESAILTIHPILLIDEVLNAREVIDHE